MPFPAQTQVAYTSLFELQFCNSLSAQLWVGRDREWLVSGEHDARLTQGAKVEGSMSTQQMEEYCSKGDFYHCKKLQSPYFTPAIVATLCKSSPVFSTGKQLHEMLLAKLIPNSPVQNVFHPPSLSIPEWSMILSVLHGLGFWIPGPSSASWSWAQFHLTIARAGNSQATTPLLMSRCKKKKKKGLFLASMYTTEMKVTEVHTEVTSHPHITRRLVASQTFRPLFSLSLLDEMKNSYTVNGIQLGCLGKSIVLWFVFFSWSKYAHLHFFHPCEAEPSMPGHALCAGTTYGGTQKQCPITVVRNSSTSSHYWEHLAGQHSAWHAGSFTDKFLCGDKAPVSGRMTDDLQTYTLA